MILTKETLNAISASIENAELEDAFQALIEAGYHMYRVYEYGSWMGYICDKKPFYHNGTEVRGFNDFID